MQLLDPQTGLVVWDQSWGTPMPQGGQFIEFDGPTAERREPPPRVNALERVFNGTGIPERVNAGHSLFNPVVALGESGQHTQNMLAPGRAPWERVSDLGKAMTGMAGTVAPMMMAARGALPVTNALVDAMSGISLPGGEFLADEFGGVKMPGQGGITAYHGSPHSFDKFSMDKIGTGEGAQAYGHGLYFAENEGVARGYRDQLSGGLLNQKAAFDGVPYDPPTPAHARAAAIIAKDGRRSAQQVLRIGLSEGTMTDADAAAYREVLNLTKGVDATALPNPGSMYEVRINANPDDFLDWDKPLSEGEQWDIGSVFNGYMDPHFEELADYFKYGNNTMTGREARQWIGNTVEKGYMPDGVFNDPSGAAAVQADKYLQEAGFPGIKYLDAGSRGAGDGSRNYVVFDENLIEIVKKYGIAGAAAMLGVTAADVQQAMAGPRQ